VKLKLQFLIAAVFVLMIYIPTVQAQANLTFSGGNGTPLSTTLQRSITYTTTTDCIFSPFFVFQGVGNVFPLSYLEVTGTISYSINGGFARPINRVNSGLSGGVLSENDVYIYNVFALSRLPRFATVVLNAGTLTTTTNFGGAPPQDGSYTTYIWDAGNRCSNYGVATTTAASVSISGRVLTNSRRGLSNAVVYLTDLEGNTRAARTNSLGYYRFNDIPAGQSVTITVVSKRYQFAPQVVNVNEEMFDLNFLAEQ